MARSGVTYFDIANAAQAVKVRGKEPTVDRVREQLGTGSKSTIGPLLKRWREQNGEAIDASGLPGDLVEVVRSLHERLQRTADDRVDQARNEAQAVVSELRQQTAQQEALLGQANADKNTLESELQATRAENVALKKELEELRLRSSKVESQRDEAWSRIADIKSSLDDQKQENRALRENYEHYQQKTAEDRQQERDEYRLAAQHHQNQIQQLLEQLTRVESRYAELQKDYKEQTRELEGLRTERQSMLERHTKLTSEMESLLLQFKEMATLRDELQKQNAGLQQQASVLQGDVSSANRSIEHLRELQAKAEQTLVLANDKIEALADENRHLIEEKAVLQGQLKQIQKAL